MKTIFSLAFLATILCATVLAAPYEYDLEEVDLEEVDLEEVGLEEGPFGIQDKIEEILKLYQCARGVIEDAMGESGMDEDLRRYAKLFENLAKVELAKCKVEKNKLKKFTCTLSGAMKFGKLFADFTKTMTEKNVKLLEKILKEYETRCMKKTNPFEINY